MLSIGEQHADEMIAHALEENPNECCGILAGKDGVVRTLYRITNTEQSPRRYLMDPQEQLNAMLDSERNGWDMLAFYHSHTGGALVLSETDVRMALESGWLDACYVLVLLHDRDSPQIRGFRVEDSGRIVEKELRIT